MERRVGGAPRGPAPRAPGRRLAILAAAVLLSPAAGAAGSPDQAPRAERLAREVDLLRKQLRLADGEAFYLLVDAAAPRLRLMLRGALLQEFPLRRVEVGAPRAFFRERPLPDGWETRVWEGGRLEPPREIERLMIEVSADGADASSEPPAIPPTPEEAVPVPASYRLLFGGGLALVVEREGEEGRGAWRSLLHVVARRARDARAALFGAEEESIHIRLHAEPQVADSIYRAVPPGASLLILSAP